MGGELPKACVDFLGRPLVAHAIDAVLPLHPEKIVVVVGYKAELVEAAVRAHFPDAPIEFALQKEQRGTADAVSAARSHLEGFEGDVLVSICDAPRLRAESLAKIIATNRIKEASAVLLSAIVEDPTGYGRIVRGEDGGVKAIVEEKNARMDEKAIREMNSGTYCFLARICFLHSIESCLIR